MQFIKSSIVLSLLLAFSSNSVLAQKKSLPCLNKEFSVVAHVVMTEADTLVANVDSIRAVMARVNELFAPICVSFNICQLDTIANFRYDSVTVEEWDEMQVIYHQQRKINLFWVNQFDFDNTLCGVSELMGIANTENGGIMMRSGPCVNEFAIAHELGRFFGVPYTFGEADEQSAELVSGENCATEGDQICDTPADPYEIGDEVSSYVQPMNNCRFVNQKRDNEGEWYVPHVGNIMSFYQDECKCDFSDGQYRLMVENYLATGPRLY
ncbi:MAG: hypothetical protein AAGJ18_02575 [Bacteroidota bacterium]